MAALPYMQLYVADYLADTVHLTTEEHGAYLLILFNYWQTGKPVRSDRLTAVARMSHDRWASVEKTLREFFTVNDDGAWVHDRIEKDLEKVKCQIHKASIAGKASAVQRAKRYSPEYKEDSNDRSTPVQQDSNDRSTITDTDTDTEVNLRSTTLSGNPPDLPDADPPKAKPLNGAHFNPMAREVLEFLNEKTGRHYRDSKPNMGLIVARLKEGVTVADCRSVIAKKCREWGKDEKMNQYLRPATLFNSTKFAQYVGELWIEPNENLS